MRWLPNYGAGVDQEVDTRQELQSSQKEVGTTLVGAMLGSHVIDMVQHFSDVMKTGEMPKGYKPGIPVDLPEVNVNPDAQMDPARAFVPG